MGFYLESRDETTCIDSWQEGAKREVKEEAGLECHIPTLLSVHFDGPRWMRFNFFGVVTGGFFWSTDCELFNGCIIQREAHRHTDIHTYTCRNAHTHTGMHTHMHASTHAHTHTHTHTHLLTPMLTHTYVQTHIHTHTHTHTHMYTCTHTHTHTHTHTITNTTTTNNNNNNTNNTTNNNNNNSHMLFSCAVLGGMSCQHSTKHWTKNNIAQPKPDKCPSSWSHFSPLNCCVTLNVLAWKGGLLWKFASCVLS